MRNLFAATALAAVTIATTAGPALAQSGSVRAISASERSQGAQANPQLLAEFGGKYDGPRSGSGRCC